MRDVNRIPQILNDLKKIWELTPDIRLGQLLLNAVDHNETTLFYIEDQDLIDKMYHEIYSNLMKDLRKYHSTMQLLKKRQISRLCVLLVPGKTLEHGIH